MATTTHTSHTRMHWLAMLLVFASFLLSAIVSQCPFERLPHLEDEVAYLFQAKILAGGHLTIESPQPHSSYWQPFVLDQEGRRFGKYAPGWPLLLAVGVLFGQPWLINACLAALTVALTYRLGCDVFDAETGLVAALLLAVSPMFLLLSGSLMAHMAATCWVVLLMWALRQTLVRRQTRWTVLGGVALGMLFNTRPLTTAGIALPFLLVTGGIILRGAWRLASRADNWRYLGQITRTGGVARRIVRSGIVLWWRGQAQRVGLAAALLLTAGAVSLLTPLYNHAATGDPGANLYTLVWAYDTIGFGPEHGRSGHTPEKALRNMQRDLALWSSDLFGWQMDAALHTRLVESTGWWLGQGLSWLLIPLGLAVGRRKPWSWLLLGTFLGLVGVHLLYWIGAQVYSARYYAEAVPALALLSAVGITAAARRFNRLSVVIILSVAFIASLYAYTPARLADLWRFNNVGADRIAALGALRDGRPVLILVTGEGRRSWRDWGTYMALTSPYLNSDVVAARDHGYQDEREAILARFPDRQVLYLPPDGILRSAE